MALQPNSKGLRTDDPDLIEAWILTKVHPDWRWSDLHGSLELPERVFVIMRAIETTVVHREDLKDG